jgi:hypothetical protein
MVMVMTAAPTLGDHTLGIRMAAGYLEAGFMALFAANTLGYEMAVFFH